MLIYPEKKRWGQGLFSCNLHLNCYIIINHSLWLWSLCSHTEVVTVYAWIGNSMENSSVNLANFCTLCHKSVKVRTQRGWQESDSFVAALQPAVCSPAELSSSFFLHLFKHQSVYQHSSAISFTSCLASLLHVLFNHNWHFFFTLCCFEVIHKAFSWHLFFSLCPSEATVNRESCCNLYLKLDAISCCWTWDAAPF